MGASGFYFTLHCVHLATKSSQRFPVLQNTALLLFFKKRQRTVRKYYLSKLQAVLFCSFPWWPGLYVIFGYARIYWHQATTLCRGRVNHCWFGQHWRQQKQNEVSKQRRHIQGEQAGRGQMQLALKQLWLKAAEVARGLAKKQSTYSKQTHVLSFYL